MDTTGQDFVSLILVSVSFAVTRQSFANVAIQQSFWFLFSQFNTQQDSLIYKLFKLTRQQLFLIRLVHTASDMQKLSIRNIIYMYDIIREYKIFYY